jgi:hypothetical protein
MAANRPIISISEEMPPVVGGDGAVTVITVVQFPV